MNNVYERHSLIIWLWLIGLVAVSVAAASVLSKRHAIVVIFSIAIIKAFLVARHYMHLKNERAIIYAIALVPVFFVVILFFGLVPDFVWHLTKK